MNPYYEQYLRLGGEPITENGFPFMQWVQGMWRQYGAEIGARMETTGGYRFYPEEREGFQAWLEQRQPEAAQ